MPHKLDVQHFIDLIADASLANPATCRTSLMEHEKFQRQVVKLGENGYIRKSMHPCAALGSWGTCTDNVINKITIRYRFPIPCLVDMLDILVRAFIFPERPWEQIPRTKFAIQPED